jgi:hypothetical protein
MKATSRPRETVSSLNYREAEGTPTATVPDLAMLAAVALGLLAREGRVSDGGANPGDRTWSLAANGPDGGHLILSCTGPDLPSVIPGETAHPSVIPFERPWVGTYRLVIRAPLIVLDLYWRPDAPLRIMGFSRGDWEAALVARAG